MLALPRPPMLRRVLQAVTSLGVKRVVLLHTARVEKSFWQSHAVGAEEIRAQLLLGLEQGRDTVLPVVEQERRFRPFVEDRLPDWAEGRRLVAHPGGPPAASTPDPVTLVIGPEGGLVPFELELLAAAGFEAVDLGPRILRVETAVPFAIGRLHGVSWIDQK